MIPERISDQSSSGSFSLKTRTLGTGVGYSHGFYALNPPITTGEIGFRAYINATGDPIPTGGWVVMLQLNGKGSPKISFDLGPGFDVYLHCPGAGWEAPSTYTLVQGKWYCAEIRVSMANKSVSLWIDDQLVYTCNPSNVSFPSGGYESANFGVGSHSTVATVFVDDVVIASGPIGCF